MFIIRFPARAALLFRLPEAYAEHRYSGGDLPTPGYDCAAIEELRDFRADAARGGRPPQDQFSVTKEPE